LILPLSARAYLGSKAGNTPSECEDAIGINRLESAFAVADGATEAYRSKQWARTLVRHWVRAPSIDAPSFIEQVRNWGGSQWETDSKVDFLPWYFAEKAQQGSFAAFTGIRVRPDRSWQVIAAGDSCLLRWRRDRFDFSFPLTEPEQFLSRPVLLPTRPDLTGGLEGIVRVASGQLEAGDVLVLATDAIANHLLQHQSSGRKLVESLTSGNAAAISDLISIQRQCKALRNDDVALISVEAASPR